MTTITVSQDVKGDLSKWKPEDVSWNTFLQVLQQSADPKRFEAQMQQWFEAQELAAVERARTRYQKHRGNPDAGVRAQDL